MNTRLQQHLFRSVVGVTRVPGVSYAGADGALQRVASIMGWEDERGPLGKVIPRGARVLIKPNLVLHENKGQGGLDPLVTHPSLIRATVEAALRTEASEVLVGDAPIQGCDFARLLQSTGLDAWARTLMQQDARFKGIRDFRRTTCVLIHGLRVAEEDKRPLEKYILFDLGKNSLLEPVTNGGKRFRVTWYDPRLLAKTHGPGFHQYLIAREVMEADVIINLPKLKTHRKAGITCALKNLVGINGNKEYLPHHRLGGSAHGGDCYPGNGVVKRAREYIADRQNMTTSYVAGAFWHGLTMGLGRISRWQGDRLGIDGSWSGNDTVWRMCLDLNRILLYGRADASMAEQVQRRVVHVVDAVIAGQADGPLAPYPLPMGLLMGAQNAAAADWVGARLLAYNPARIPLVCGSFQNLSYPLVDFASSQIRLTGDLGEGLAGDLLQRNLFEVDQPLGWRNAAATGEDAAVASGSVASRTKRPRDEAEPWDA